MGENKWSLEKLESMLDEVRLYTLFHITKNGKIYSTVAEGYLKYISKYSKYCIPEMADGWINTIRNLIYNDVLVLNQQYQNDSSAKQLIKDNNYEIIDNLYNFMDAGVIMEVYNNTHSWEEVDKVLKSQGHSGFTFSGLLNVMIKYSVIGADFADRYAALELKRDSDLKKAYKKLKNNL